MKDKVEELPIEEFDNDNQDIKSEFEETFHKEEVSKSQIDELGNSKFTYHDNQSENN